MSVLAPRCPLLLLCGVPDSVVQLILTNFDITPSSRSEQLILTVTVTQAVDSKVCTPERGK